MAGVISQAGNTDDDWSKHEYIDKMRNSDPFLAHKKKGTKMKAVHDHVAEKATEHLGNATGIPAWHMATLTASCSACRSSCTRARHLMERPAVYVRCTCVYVQVE